MHPPGRRGDGSPPTPAAAPGTGKCTTAHFTRQHGQARAFSPSNTGRFEFFEWVWRAGGSGDETA